MSISSNWMQEPIFLCNRNPCDLQSTFIDAWKILATQSKTQTESSIVQNENTRKIGLAHILEKLNQRRCHFVAIEAEDDASENSSTQSLQMQKNQLIGLQELFERWCNALPILGFNSASYDINFIKNTYYLFL